MAGRVQNGPTISPEQIAARKKAVALARTQIGKSRFKKIKADAVDAGFTRWIFSEFGITLPQNPVQQRDAGHSVTLSESSPADLVFRAGKNGYASPRGDEVAHVGILTGGGTVIHATTGQVTEEPTADFLREPGSYRGTAAAFPLEEELQPKR